ncbi:MULTISPECIES: NAD(P)-dependent alcohol dehydrogenase [unclassified Oceanispirochaeta]|uniref:NAD(P)-dependent alcohol dehydrogenase n=1 Tax=unclassified Oceanispirochaeta TaxID=2635722 RepID=UPI000E093A53|nr:MULTISPECIES: NAD(P)-dependent alcohol dehydrogenase [unclassified Oceanispirochaeta]MBF9017600.1 NAD(P)-dependent alcohol dehydrogenase [Oceanispirochaeta sp. M2]NPD74172.1 NAD(P)-dependent alcohol dehydrogenase [Oceanispirochaeta sp. M1]RDG29985.1 NAD(P)-dependent alcohol dehydrogenase [Oceanispirochaeta sp. M1]
MKAIVQNDYASPDALKVKEVEKPKIKKNEVLVKVIASSINAGDLFSLNGTPFIVRFSVGFPKPKDFILGWDVAGKIVEVGKDITEIKVGDEIFGSTESAFAEYVVMDMEKLARKPSNMSFEEAAAAPTAAITALQRLRDGGNIKKGQKVLITGASGGVGSFAVQIAKSLGAEVTGLCSTGKVDMVRSIGADHVIDYQKEDFTKSDMRFDLILDNTGNRSFSDMKRVLTSDGMIIPNSGHGGMSYVIKAFALAPFTKKIGVMKIADLNTKDFNILRSMMESGDIRPVVDKVFPFEKIPDAIKYLEDGLARGKIVISMDSEGS